MPQHINLYELLPRRSKFYIILDKMWYVYAIFFIILMVNYAIELGGFFKIKKQMNAMNQEYVELKQKVDILTGEYSSSDIASMQAQVDNMKKELEAKSKVLDILSQDVNFSSYLEALGKAVVPGLWLTEMSFIMQDHQIILKGNALQADLVNQFIDQLKQQSAFKGLSFELREITQVIEDKGEFIRFEVGTESKART